MLVLVICVLGEIVWCGLMGTVARGVRVSCSVVGGALIMVPHWGWQYSGGSVVEVWCVGCLWFEWFVSVFGRGVCVCGCLLVCVVNGV